MACCTSSRKVAKIAAIKAGRTRSNAAQAYASKLRAQGVKPQKVADQVGAKFYKPKKVAGKKQAPQKVKPCKLCGAAGTRAANQAAKKVT